MREKKEGLLTIADELSLNVSGLENYTPDSPSVIVANHTSMRDIFSLPAALPEACKIIISARLAWKRNTAENSLRRDTIEGALNVIPLEVHGGPARLQTGLDMAQRALSDGWSVVIFPEGAYTGNPQVTKGRTGAARILFDALTEGVAAQLLPVGINQSPVEDLDDFQSRSGTTHISIGAPLQHIEHHQAYLKTENLEQRKQALRSLTDIAMTTSAQHAQYPYVHEYIPLWKRDTVVLESGEEVPV